MQLRRTLAMAAVAVSLGAAATVVLAGRGGPQPGPDPIPMGRADTPTFALTVIADGLEAPTWVGAAPGDDPGALWVAERGGRLKRLAGDGLRSRTVLLDLRDAVSTGAEQGLLSVAFVPDFAERREVVVSLTDPRGDSRIELWRLGASAAQARRIRTLLTLDQPFPNHNGGHVEFGPHHTLYTGFGDGGGAGDPSDSAQEPGRRLGKILAIDLAAGPRPRGARWRPAQEPLAVLVRPGARRDVDRRCRAGPDGGDQPHPARHVGAGREPRVERLRGAPPVPGPRDPRHAGAHLARGQLRARARPLFGDGRAHLPRQHGRPLRGRYLFGDFCTGELWTVEPGAGIAARDLRLEVPAAPQVAHIGADADGELLLALLDGRIQRVTPAS